MYLACWISNRRGAVVSYRFYFALRRSATPLHKVFIFQYKPKQSGILICEWNTRLFFSYQYALLRQLSHSLHRESRTLSSIFFSWKCNRVIRMNWFCMQFCGVFVNRIWEGKRNRNLRSVCNVLCAVCYTVVTGTEPEPHMHKLNLFAPSETILHL